MASSGGKIAHALQQGRRNFLAAGDQEQAFPGFQILADDHAHGYVLHHALELQGFFLGTSAQPGESFRRPLSE